MLARILTGRIAAWNDPILAALNPGIAMPDTKITPIYRVDSSGTTDNLQKYLTAAAPESWSRGVGTEFQGGVGEGAAKSSGVVQAVRTIRGAIGYVEKGFADQAGLPYAQIDTGNGVVPLTSETAGNAINAATFVARWQRPGAEPELAVRHSAAGCLPVGAGHLRDRLLEGLRRGNVRSNQVLPDRRREHRSGQPRVGRLHPVAR